MDKKNKRQNKNKIKQKALKKHTQNNTKRKKGYPPNPPILPNDFLHVAYMLFHQNLLITNHLPY